MGTLDDVTNMIRDGRSDSEILTVLKQRGLTDKEISSVLTQTKIKDAVSGYESVIEPAPPAPTPSSRQQSNASVQEYGEMSPSLMSPEETAPQSPSQPEQEQYAQQDQTYASAPEAYGDYAYQPQYSAQAMGSDLISEIADQIVTEKLAPIVTGVDKIMDMRSNMESQLKYLDERLKRIEKIIDRLQLSLLQRVGEYVSNVEDIKKEMVETQKSFKSLIEKQ